MLWLTQLSNVERLRRLTTLCGNFQIAAELKKSTIDESSEFVTLLLSLSVETDEH